MERIKDVRLSGKENFQTRIQRPRSTRPPRVETVRASYAVDKSADTLSFGSRRETGARSLEPRPPLTNKSADQIKV
jgi:hypothetical protein